MRDHVLLSLEGHATIDIADETRRDLRKRVIAWERHRGVAVDTQPAHFLTEAVNLLSRIEVDELIAAIKTMPQKPVLVVIDTLARSMVGDDENSAKDMSLLTAAVDRLKLEFGCAILLVHHTGHTNTDRERGSSVLRCAVETVIVGTKDEDVIKLRCERQRSSELFGSITARNPKGGTRLPRPDERYREGTSRRPALAPHPPARR